MLQRNTELLPSATERNHTITDSPVKLTDGSTASALSLAKRFYESPYGAEMRQQPLRYSGRYEYDRQAMLNDLGHDVCPIGHQVELAFHLGFILAQEEKAETIYSGLSDTERGVLTLACLLHDIGESTHHDLEREGYATVGDIAAGLKTDVDRQNEAAIRQYFYKEFLGDVDEAMIEKIEAIISHTDESHLHDLFEAAHVLQTFETSNYAHHQLMATAWHRNGEVIDITSTDAARQSGLLGIARVAAEHALDELKKYRFLGAIDNMFVKATDLRHPKHRLFN